MIVAHTRVVREAGFHYFIKNGGVVKMDRKTKEQSVLHPNAFTPEQGKFYFLNKDGNVEATDRAVRQKKQEPVVA